METKHLPYRRRWARDLQIRDKSTDMLFICIRDHPIMRTTRPTDNVSMACDLSSKPLNRPSHLVNLTDEICRSVEKA